MKNKAVHLHVRRPVAVFAAATVALFLLSGCGSGYHSSTDPVYEPSPITTRASYANPNLPTIAVSFPTLTVVVPVTFVEYHIYRNEVLVARIPQAEDAVNPTDGGMRVSMLTYTDIGETPPADYKTVGQPPVQLTNARSPGVGPFSSSTPLTYRVTALYGSKGIEGQNTYIENDIGRSDTITPFH